MQRRGRLLADGLEVDQGVEIGFNPVPGRLRIVDLDDVASERKHDDVVPAGREREVAGDVCRTFSAIPSDRIWARRRAALNFSARMSRRKFAAHLSMLYLNSCQSLKSLFTPS